MGEPTISGAWKTLKVEMIMQEQTFGVASSQNLSIDDFCRSWSLGITLISIICSILTPCHSINDAFDEKG